MNTAENIYMRHDSLTDLEIEAVDNCCECFYKDGITKYYFNDDSILVIDDNQAYPEAPKETK